LLLLDVAGEWAGYTALLLCRLIPIDAVGTLVGAVLLWAGSSVHTTKKLGPSSSHSRLHALKLIIDFGKWDAMDP